MIGRRPIAAGRFRGERMADGKVWARFCQDCRGQQADDRRVNDPCQACGCGVVVWEPRFEARPRYPFNLPEKMR